MHVKVIYDKQRFIVPFKSTNKLTIQKLSELIKTKYMSEYGVQEFKILELTTVDDFILNMDDLTEDIIQNGDVIKITTIPEFFKKNAPLCVTEWHKITREDLKDKLSKGIGIGKHQYNKLYVKFSVNNYSKEVHVLDAKKFTGSCILTESNVIGSMQDEKSGKWYIEARYSTNEKKEIKGVELHVKTASERVEWVDIIHVGLSKTGQLLFSEVVHIKGSDDSDDDEDESTYEMPKSIANGPDNENDEEVDLSNRSFRGTRNDEIASPAITMKTNDSIYERSGIEISWNLKDNLIMNQDSWKNGEGKFNSYFTIKNIIIENKLGDVYKIMKTEVFWKNRLGEWILCNARLGEIQNGNIIWNEKSTAFEIEKLQKYKLNLDISILTEGDIGYDYYSRGRLSSYFPKPLHVKVCLTNSNFNVIEHLCVLKNKPVAWKTKEDVEKDVKASCQFIYCDNTIDGTRNYAAVYKKENILHVKFSNGYTYSLNPSDIKSIGFNALDADEKVFLMKDWSKVDGRKNEVVTYALVDENGKMYGLKFDFKTPSSTKTQWVLLPKLLKPRKSLLPLSIVVDPLMYKIGEEINIFWNMSSHIITQSDYIAVYMEKSDSYVKYKSNSSCLKTGVIVLPVDNYFKVGQKYIAKYMAKGDVVIASSKLFDILA
eukprot:gene9605-1807_t